MIRTELNHRLRNAGVWARRFGYREDPQSGSADDTMRRYEVFPGAGPASGEADATVAALDGDRLPSSGDSKGTGSTTRGRYRPLICNVSHRLWCFS